VKGSPTLPATRLQGQMNPTLLLALAAGCAPGADTGDTAVSARDYSAPGSFGVGRHTSTVSDDARARTLTVETWYPSDAAPGDQPISDLVVGDSDRSAYEALLAEAPDGCPSLTTTAAVDAAPSEDPAGWPVIAMSHCHDCTRFSTVSVAEHLASWGFVVVAPDHAGNTLFDELAGDALPLDTDTLALREGDIELVLDQALAGGLVDGLAVDPARVGVFGHSFGAVTAGIVLQDRLGADGGPIAGMFVGAPPENPFLPGVSVDALDAPLLFELLGEDHSIGDAGNVLIQSNYDAAPSTAWLYDVADAGHWSPSDLVGLTADFMPGCGDDTRESTGEAFTYVDPAEGRALSGALAAAFFSAYVAGDPGGLEWLAGESADARVTVQSKE